MRRELAEETGLHIDTASLFGLYSGPEGFGDYPNGDRVFSIQVVWRTVTVRPVLQQSDAESLDLAFFSREAFVAEDDLHRHQRRILMDWLSGDTGPFLR
ncbi:MutT/nudix family protein [mine drainage metagenome]|uniref:MutT/nudix family protein n=1 Tax=mine drainage metagenome TaxID=410659 RepID=T1CD81_9ZZZZ